MIGIGLAIFFGHLQNIIYTITFTKKKVYLFPFIFAACLLLIGTLFTFDRFSNLKIVDGLPQYTYIETKEEFIEEIKNPVIFENWNTTFQIDPMLADHQVRVEVYYYPNNNRITRNYENRGELEDRYYIECYRSNSYSDYQIFYRTLESIYKENTIYDYSELNDIRVVVYANENTKPLLKLSY